MMKPVLIALLLLASRVYAQENKPPESTPAPSATSANPSQLPGPAPSDKPKLTREELEAKFKAMLTQATLTGRWAPIKDGALGPEKEDQYTVLGVSKLSGDTWVVQAKMQYGQREIVAPIPVIVQWAGDTPVLIVDKMQIPGGGTYSARVLFYNHTYAGTWSGGEHGGLLYGVITNQAK